MRQALREFQETPDFAPRAPGSGGGAGARNVFVPDLSQIPQTGFGVGNLVFESRDYDWSDYARQIYWEILKAWYRRLWAETDEFEKWGLGTRTWFLDHRTRVSFVIERSGQVTTVRQESASGCPPLDRSALDALEEVILPPLPEGFPRDHETVHALFLVLGEIRGMRQTLQEYRGWF
jgi:TonB family protein